jgi:hypothetical protein
MKSIFTKRLTLSTLMVLVLVLTASLVASGAATTKQLSTNFTLVNLATGTNTVNIQYYTSTGAQWRTPEQTTLTGVGDQLIRRQYTDAALQSGSGSVVVGGSGAMGAVVQIRAINQTPTSGAYSGASAGSSSANVPLVAKNQSSASGVLNSQVIVQNTGTAATSASIQVVNASGAVVYTTPSFNLALGTAYTYDVTNDANFPAGIYSAVVNAASGGQVAVVSNLFMGTHGVQTFNAFTTKSQKWVAPLFTSRLSNNLSTPITVQNLSGNTIPVGGIVMSCKANPASTVTGDVNASNTAAVNNTASYSFNPVVDQTIPAGFQGACTITTTGFDTVAFVQMRFIGTDNVAAYEALDGTSTKTKVVVPLYLKRLTNGFATAVTIANLGTQAATVNVTYKKSAEITDPNLVCDLSFSATIAVGESLVQNHRIASGANSVPQISDTCQGSMTIESTNGQPIDAFSQITVIIPQAGDTFMAHDAFPY